MKQRPQMVDKATMVDMIDLFPVHDTQNRTETDLVGYMQKLHHIPQACMHSLHVQVCTMYMSINASA